MRGAHMKKYALSVNAANDYKKNSKHSGDISVDVLKAKLNCMIEASEKHVQNIGATSYIFGRCSIRVTNTGVIKSIQWKKNRVAASNKEIHTLKCLYRKVGLNSSGTEFKKEEKEKCTNI